MWLKVDDSVIDHPKMFAAGRHLGKRGRARAFCVYMAGLSWTNRHLTDGCIPDEAVRSFSIDDHPIDVAAVLAYGDVLLWHRVDGGYQIHDYHDHNPKAEQIKAKLKRDRDRKRKDREARDAAKDSAAIPRGHPDGIHADSSALAGARSRSRSQPLQPREDHRGSRRDADRPVENLRVLKALVWREVHAAYDDPSEDWTLSSVTERLKVVASKAGLVYAVDSFHAQIEAAFARVPLQRRRSA